MPDRVNARVNAVEPSSLDSRCHLIRRQAACSKLVEGKNAPILRGVARNALIGTNGPSLDFFGARPNNSRVGVLHVPIVGRGDAQSKTRVWRMRAGSNPGAWISS
jgi:hypothetical protein